MLFVIKNSSGKFFTKQGCGPSAVYGWTRDSDLDSVWKQDGPTSDNMLDYLKDLGAEKIEKEIFEG